MIGYVTFIKTHYDVLERAAVECGEVNGLYYFADNMIIVIVYISKIAILRSAPRPSGESRGRAQGYLIVLKKYVAGNTYFYYSVCVISEFILSGKNFEE